MKILWLTNILPRFLAKRMDAKTISNLGWLDYSAEKLLENSDIDLYVVYPDDVQTSGTVDGINYESFPKRYSLRRNDSALAEIFSHIIEKIDPDIIHIHGTEYYHTLAMAKAVVAQKREAQTVVSIQGLVSVIADHYTAGLPHGVTKKYTFRDLLKRENILGQRKGFVTRGKAEIEALRMIPNVIGRTEWDKACTYHINPTRKYYLCNETLRKIFYDGEWSLDKCEKHSIFVSQSSYAIKALHQVIEALPIILKDYPDAKIYVTGGDVFKRKWYKINSYHKYLRDRIKKLGLQGKVVFLGTLNEDKMKERFIRSHVFVMSSSIENSPNSLGEAMMLGVPSIASDVGGVSSIFTHERDGFMYPFDAPYMLAYYTCRIFSDSDIANKFSQNAKLHAQKTHDCVENARVLYDIYQELRNN